MTRTSKILAALMSLSLAGAATAASAAVPQTWAQKHPRRVEMNGRLHRQDLRIHQERKEGELTATQARDLHAEDHGIRGEERFDASHDNSHLTKGEQHALNVQENAVSKQIGR